MEIGNQRNSKSIYSDFIDLPIESDAVDLCAVEDGSCTGRGEIGDLLSFLSSANAGHFANATTHISTRTPPGISTINASAGLNPVLWKSLQKGMTKKIVNVITQGMILDSSTYPPMMYDNDLPAGLFVHTPVGVTRLPIYCVAFSIIYQGYV